MTRVVMVGAGPASPLTQRAGEILARADLVLFDRTVTGTWPSADHQETAEIDLDLTAVERAAAIVARAGVGGIIVRLTAGEPMMGPPGEELAHLQAAGLGVEVLPAIPAPLAALAVAGISAAGRPVVLVGSPTSAEWKGLVATGSIVVGELPPSDPHGIELALRLRLVDPEILLTVVTHPFGPRQRTWWSSVGAGLPIALGAVVTGDESPPSRPANLFVVGAAPAQTPWAERRPLSGRRVIVTRTRDQASGLRQLLASSGAEVLEIPTIAVVDPDDGGRALDHALAGIANCDWLILTSPNGANRLCDRLRDGRQLAGVKIACVGPATAAVLAERARLVADLVPAEAVAEALLEAFPGTRKGGRVLLVRAAVARDVLPDGLEDRGWAVEVVDAYRTVRPDLTPWQLAAVRSADIVTFTSSSTVRHFVEMVGLEAVPAVVACIGPVTAQTARELGLDVTIVAADHTVAGLAAALESGAQARRG